MNESVSTSYLTPPSNFQHPPSPSDSPVNNSSPSIFRWARLPGGEDDDLMEDALVQPPSLVQVRDRVAVPSRYSLRQIDRGQSKLEREREKRESERLRLRMVGESNLRRQATKV